MNFDYKTYHTFENDGKYYLFDNEHLISCVIEKRLHNALITNDDSMLEHSELEMLKAFHDNNIFFIDNPKSNYLIPDFDMVIISMAVFHGCNLNCKYCFADAGENYHEKQKGFSIESINAAIDFLLMNPYFAKMNYYRINLVGGGEPLLKKAIFRMFITTAFDRFEKANKHLYIWFSTNGTLLTEEDLSFIGKYNVGYGISIDGDKLSNDKIRVYKDGSGTYDDIAENISAIQKSKIVPKRLKELWGLMVYTKENARLLDNIIHLRDMGFSTIQMRFVRSNDNSLNLDLENAKEELIAFVKAIFNEAISGDDSLLRIICNDNDYIGKIIKRVVTQAKSEVRCSAGSYMFSFAADGKIYPCDGLVGNSKFVMGNFYDTIDNEQFCKYKDLSIHVREKCSKCWAKYICGGDCYHNSYLKHGDFFTPDELYCSLILKIAEYIISYVNQYKMNNRNGYNAFYNFLLIRELFGKK